MFVTECSNTAWYIINIIISTNIVLFYQKNLHSATLLSYIFKKFHSPDSNIHNYVHDFSHRNRLMAFDRRQKPAFLIGTEKFDANGQLGCCGKLGLSAMK